MCLPSAYLGCADRPVCDTSETQELHPNTAELIEQVAQLKVEKQGIDAWFDLEPAELLGDEADQYSKVTDTLDVWFDSGVTHSLRTGSYVKVCSSLPICIWKVLTSTVAGSSPP